MSPHSPSARSLLFTRVLPEEKDIGMHSSEHEYSAENFAPGNSKLDSQISAVGLDLAHDKPHGEFVSCPCHCSLTWRATAGGVVSIRLSKSSSGKHLMFRV